MQCACTSLATRVCRPHVDNQPTACQAELPCCARRPLTQWHTQAHIDIISMHHTRRIRPGFCPWPLDTPLRGPARHRSSLAIPSRIRSCKRTKRKPTSGRPRLALRWLQQVGGPHKPDNNAETSATDTQASRASHNELQGSRSLATVECEGALSESTTVCVLLASSEWM